MGAKRGRKRFGCRTGLEVLGVDRHDQLKLYPNFFDEILREAAPYLPCPRMMIFIGREIPCLGE